MKHFSTPTRLFSQLNDLVNSANNAQIKYDGLTGISENGSAANDILVSSVYPNPVNQSATISIVTGNPTYISVQVADALGRVVYSINDYAVKPGRNIISIETNHYDNGIYSCIISANGKTQVKKITVAH